MFKVSRGVHQNMAPLSYIMKRVSSTRLLSALLRCTPFSQLIALMHLSTTESALLPGPSQKWNFFVQESAEYQTAKLEEAEIMNQEVIPAASQTVLRIRHDLVFRFQCSVKMPPLPGRVASEVSIHSPLPFRFYMLETFYIHRLSLVTRSSIWVSWHSRSRSYCPVRILFILRKTLPLGLAILLGGLIQLRRRYLGDSG